jgi:hypothetical protein
MNKQELKKQIEKLQAEYEAMPDDPKRLFEVAELGDTYYIVDELFKEYSGLRYGNDSTDERLIKLGNHFTDSAEAERMASFIRKNFPYWRMALRFADGYEWEEGRANHYVLRVPNSFENCSSFYEQEHGTVYMTKENAKRFADFCNENKEELGL